MVGQLLSSDMVNRVDVSQRYSVAARFGLRGRTKQIWLLEIYLNLSKTTFSLLPRSSDCQKATFFLEKYIGQLFCSRCIFSERSFCCPDRKWTSLCCDASIGRETGKAKYMSTETDKKKDDDKTEGVYI
jgi:hypothetical protein